MCEKQPTKRVRKRRVNLRRLKVFAIEQRALRDMEKRFEEFRSRLLKEELIEFPSKEELLSAYTKSAFRIPYQKEAEE